jgi:tetratricopeptide (TPR) repeat protein
MKLFFLLVILTIASWFLRPKKAVDTKKPYNYSNIVYCAPSFDPSQVNAGNAPLLTGLGDTRYTITTKAAKAQTFFNQGLALLYGFNHGESARSFKTAIQIDSTCAMAYWGLAMVLGPNYNAALNPASLADINDAIAHAVKYSDKVSPNEKALINAMAKRFPAKAVDDMTPYYEAYARALREAYQQFPNDFDIATVLADALMNLHPWNLWLKDGTAQPWTPEIISILEKTLAASPNHAGAIHYYIHATEASKKADVAVPYADKLADLMPAAGHMVHMPAHTYIRTGDYHKGVLVTEQATIADSTYVVQCKAQGMYPLMYYPHNVHFLAACAFFEGSSKKALDAAWMVSRKADRKFLAEHIGVQHYYIIPYYVMVHLAKWDDILQLPQPGESLLYPVAVWHYARGMAYAAKNDVASAQRELSALQAIAKNESLKAMLVWDMNNAGDLVNIAAFSLEAELLGYKKQYDASVALFKKAIAIEDSLLYTEPPDWFFSVRHSLGHWLLQAKRFDEAEQVYREDLETYKENGWALMGLYKALQGQQRSAESIAVKQRFDKAWQWADIRLSSSRLY